MNALSLYGSSDLSRRYGGDALDALLDGGRKRRAKRRKPKKSKKHSAEALFAALGLDVARKRRRRSAKKRRTPPRDPRTGLFLKRGAKRHQAKRRRHSADSALFAALGLDVARTRRKAPKAHKAPKRRRATPKHTQLMRALFGAAKKKRSAPRRSYLSPEGFGPEDLKILTALGKIAPTKAAKMLSEQEQFIQSCQKSARVQKICNELWGSQKIKLALASIRQAAGAL